MSKALFIKCTHVCSGARITGSVQVSDLDDFIHAKGEDTVWFYSDNDSLYPVAKSDLRDFRIGDE